MNNKLKVAIQKNGRLTEKSTELLRNIGFDFEPNDRQLLSSCTGIDASILSLRDDDIPEFVYTGVSDIGIVGRDQVLESELDVQIVENLGFGKCRLSVAVKKDSTVKSIKELRGLRLATSFPNIVRKYFEERKIKIEIIQIAGAVEIAPTIGIADGIVDLVSSGFTLDVNGLRVLQDLIDMEAVLIVSPKINSKKMRIVEDIVQRINSISKASKYKYILINLPEKSLVELKKISPGLKSPTISKLATPGWISAQTVIEENTFWESIDKLKKIGAQDILVTPIEKIIL